MKTQQPRTMAGYRINEYMLVLVPHEELASKIAVIREEFATKFESPQAKWGRPQIVLATFSQYEMMEERILAKMRNHAMGFPPFRIELKDFGSFPTHTIYINVATKVAVQSLLRDIRSGSQRIMKLNDDNKPLFIMEPHVTIARKLKPWQYEKGWAEFSQRHFTGKFIADSMILLKKEKDMQRFHLVERMSFQNLPVNTRQGELF